MSATITTQKMPLRRETVGHRPPLTYLPALDGLRAVAVLAVMVYHTDAPWLPGGFLGVDVFFVLSGFLITTLLLQGAAAHGSPDFKAFYLRRARRLLPALLAVLLGSTLLVVTIATDSAGNQQRDLPAALAYVLNWSYIFHEQSYFEATGRPPMLEHLWSLAVEEQFYLVWPWVFLLAWRLGGAGRVRRFALIGAAASALLMAALSIVRDYPGSADPSRVYFGSDTHAMGLLVGAALATLWIPRRAAQQVAAGARLVIDGVAVGGLAVLLAVFAITDFGSGPLYRGGFLLLSLLVAVVIVAVTHPAGRAGLWLGSAPMRYIGTRSYGLYLWHWPIFVVTRPGLDVPLSGAANLAVRFALTFAAAELSYRYLEAPVRRLGFRAAWAEFRLKLRAARGIGAWTAERPVVLLAVAVGVLGLVGLRLYTLPAQASFVQGIAEEMLAEPEAVVLQPAGAAPRPGVLGIGESVMMGAGEALTEAIPGVMIDAAVGRQEWDTVARIDELGATGQLPTEVFLHMGSNGPLTEAGVRGALDTLRAHGVERIAVINVSVPRRWQDRNNEVLRTVLADQPDAVLVDWRAEVLADPGLVVADGIHPSGRGVARYAELVRTALDGVAEPEELQGSDGEPVLQNEDEVRNHPALVNPATDPAGRR